MFVDMTLRRNEALIKAAAKFHQNGDIPANTYVIDLDSLEKNVRELCKAAKENGIKLYYMTKQIGRSGFIGKTIEENGISKAVAVDIDEAINLAEGGCQIGHLGHLVQPSKSQWEFVLKKLQPEVVTLFSYERAQQLSDIAANLGRKQDVLLRVVSKTDMVYPGQSGGFTLENLEMELARLLELPGINLAGITNFPVLQMNESKTGFHFTSNLETIKKAKTILQAKGIEVKQVNAPSATSCMTMPLLREQGVTHGEPGHAITGTTPLHAYDENLPEVPSIVYVSEISHLDEDYAYTIAGGFYPRSNMEKALYGSNPTNLVQQITNIGKEAIGNIDYYGSLQKQPGMTVGDTVIYAFRTQIFVTRAHVAFVRGLHTNQPKLAYFQRRGQ